MKSHPHEQGNKCSQDVLYKWLPSHCLRCKTFGHSCNQIQEKAAPIYGRRNWQRYPRNRQNTNTQFPANRRYQKRRLGKQSEEVLCSPATSDEEPADEGKEIELTKEQLNILEDIIANLKTQNSGAGLIDNEGAKKDHSESQVHSFQNSSNRFNALVGLDEEVMDVTKKILRSH